MSRHIVTVCVVCVLCASHVHCSAHTDLPAGVVHTVLDNSTNPKNPSSVDTQGQLLWTLERHKEETAYSGERDRSSSFGSNNKRDAVRYNDTRRIINDNNNARVSVDVIANDDTYVKKKIAKNFKGGGSAQDRAQQSLTSENAPANDSRDTELLERLAQTELSNRKPARFSRDSHTINSSRLKRDVAVDDKYFMRKIFEAYGDGKSITMSGFEKLVRKLGLLELLNDVEDGSVNSMRKNQLGNQRRSFINR